MLLALSLCAAALAALSLSQDANPAYKEWSVNGHTVRLPYEATWAPPSVPPPSPPLPTTVTEHHNPAECGRWASMGECAKNPSFMAKSCALSCEAVGKVENDSCGRWAKLGECTKNPSFMAKSCAHSCEALAPKDTFEDPASCVNWANSGECDTNQAFMFAQCAGSCHGVGARKQAYAERCPPNNSTDALQPGSLMPMFERAVSNFPHLAPTLLSPSPPIALFDNFISEEEIAALVRAGRGKFKRSTVLDVGTQGGVQHSIRTSSNTWCDSADCLDDKHVRAVTERVAEVTGVPHTNAEFAQLLEYKACPDGSTDCQFYKRHHDYIESDRERQQAHIQKGVRILTLFIYLSNVTQGGETAFFTDPGLSVPPKAGRAVLWSQVLDDQPHKMDPRTEHEARPVIEGTKLAANFWIHQHDFKGPHARGCTVA